jgi:hypothetical protein
MNILCYNSKTNSCYEVELNKVKSLFECNISANLENGIFINLGNFFLIYAYSKEQIKDKYLEVVDEKIHKIGDRILVIEGELKYLESEIENLKFNKTTFIIK